MADETKRETMQQFNLKLYPQDIDRFNTILGSMENVNTKVQALSALMDFWENPKTVVKDNPALTQRIAELEAESEKRTQELTDLSAKLDAAQQEANTNGQTSSQLQLRIEQLEAENAALRAKKSVPENVITTEVHPVAWHFLKKMAEHETKRKGEPIEPGYILTDLFIRDLQNPRSNNLPYIVETDEIRNVMNQYNAAQKEKEADNE